MIKRRPALVFLNEVPTRGVMKEEILRRWHCAFESLEVAIQHVLSPNFQEHGRKGWAGGADFYKYSPRASTGLSTPMELHQVGAELARFSAQKEVSF